MSGFQKLTLHWPKVTKVPLIKFAKCIPYQISKLVLHDMQQKLLMVNRLLRRSMHSFSLFIIFSHFSFIFHIIMPQISIHTLHLRVLDIVTSCLSNWSNPKLDLTIESYKTEHSSMVFINVKIQLHQPFQIGNENFNT